MVNTCQPSTGEWRQETRHQGHPRNIVSCRLAWAIEILSQKERDGGQRERDVGWRDRNGGRRQRQVPRLGGKHTLKDIHLPLYTCSVTRKKKEDRDNFWFSIFLDTLDSVASASECWDNRHVPPAHLTPHFTNTK